MKRNNSLVILFWGLTLLVLAGCTYRLKKDVIGVWKIEDIIVTGDTSMFDRNQFQVVLEDQKKLRFEILPDSDISIYTGSARINGKWTVQWRGRKVFVAFEDNPGRTLLGSYIDGKLVNRDTNAMGTILIATYLKELPPPAEEEKK
jgi:hypothetical protein